MQASEQLRTGLGHSIVYPGPLHEIKRSRLRQSDLKWVRLAEGWKGLLAIEATKQTKAPVQPREPCSVP